MTNQQGKCNKSCMKTIFMCVLSVVFSLQYHKVQHGRLHITMFLDQAFCGSNQKNLKKIFKAKTSALSPWKTAFKTVSFSLHFLISLLNYREQFITPISGPGSAAFTFIKNHTILDSKNVQKVHILSIQSIGNGYLDC